MEKNYSPDLETTSPSILSQEPYLGIGLCNSEALLSPAERQELARDLEALQSERKRRPESFYTDQVG